MVNHNKKYFNKHCIIFIINSSGKYAYYPEDWVDISDQAKDLINKILVVDSWKRINIMGILKHPWIKNPPNINISSTQKRLEMYQTQKKGATQLSPLKEEPDSPFTPKVFLKYIF